MVGCKILPCILINGHQKILFNPLSLCWTKIKPVRLQYITKDWMESSWLIGVREQHIDIHDYMYMAWFCFMWHSAQMKQRIFFKDPLKIIQKLVFFQSFFCIFLLIFGWKLQKIWFSGFRCNLGCAPYAQSWVFFLKCSKYSFFVALILSW